MPIKKENQSKYPGDNRAVNLLALCQRCHNRIDQPYRQLNAAQTNRAKKADKDMFGDEK